MVLTEQQRSARRVTMSVYVPFTLEEQLIEVAERMEISKNELVNRCLNIGFKNVLKGEATNQTPYTATTAVEATEAPTNHRKMEVKAK